MKMSQLRAIVKDKKGFGLGDAIPAVMVVFILFILLIVIVYTITQLGASFTASSAAANASSSLVTQVSNNIPIAGLVLTIVLIALVIGALLSVLVTRGAGGRL